MSEAIRYGVALRALLQRIVANGSGGAQRGGHIARLNELRLALAHQQVVLTLRPHAGEAIRLQLDSDLDRVGVGFAARRLLRLLRARQDAKQVLHVMPDLVCDHVGLRELARLAAAAAETGFELAEKRGVEIDLLIHRTVERA